MLGLPEQKPSLIQDPTTQCGSRHRCTKQRSEEGDEEEEEGISAKIWFEPVAKSLARLFQLLM